MALLVSTTIYITAFGASLLSSGAPARVHAVDAIGLLIAFWVPAQFTTSVEALRARWRLVLGFIVAGTFLWDILSAVVIAKRELFMGGVLLYPGAALVFTALLLFHAMITAALRPGLTNR